MLKTHAKILTIALKIAMKQEENPGTTILQILTQLRISVI